MRVRKRRHLGDFWYRTRDGELVRVAVYVNAAEVGCWLGRRAHDSKTKRATAMNGAVLVEALP